MHPILKYSASMYMEEPKSNRAKKHLIIASYAGIGLILLVGVLIARHMRRRRVAPEPAIPAVQAVDPLAPIRALPEKFPRGSHLPNIKERDASGAVDLETFSPGRDLTYLDDPRVWWESDNDKNDTEDDHTIYVTMVQPFRRLIEMVCKRGATLKVQDTYRPTGIHNPRSLHKEGRAIDLTCDDMDLEDLAELCWAAGFDWVYYEAPRIGNGAHIHCSVRRRTDLPPR